MKDGAGGSSSLGTPNYVYNIYTTYIVGFPGNITGNVAAGATLTATGKSHTSSAVSYNSTQNRTDVTYTLGTGDAFTTSDSITASSAGDWVIVGETRIKATTDLYTQYALSGSLSNRTLSTVDVRLTVERFGSSFNSDTSTGVDYIQEISGVAMGIR